MDIAPLMGVTGKFFHFISLFSLRTKLALTIRCAALNKCYLLKLKPFADPTPTARAMTTIRTQRYFNPSLSILLAVLVSFAAAAVLPALAEERVITVGVYENAPKVFVAESGEPGGIFIDVIEEIARREAWRLRYVPGTWDEGLDRLARGDIDLMPDVAHSPGGYSLPAALITEIVMTMMFLLIILGATDSRAPQGFAPIAIGLCLTLIHLISIPVTNTSVNPARSTGVAVFAGDWALAQLWLFWVAPIVGAVIGAMVYRYIGNEN